MLSGYSLRKIRLLLLAGMSTWKRRAGAQGCTLAREQPSPITYHPLQAQPVGLGQLPQQRRVPQPPGGIAAGREARVTHGDSHPQSSPSSPRLGGCTQACLILKDHAGRELPAAAGAGVRQRGQDGPPGA